MKRRLLRLFALTAALAALVGISTGTALAQESNVAIKVNGETVKQSELNKAIDRTYQRMKQRFGKRLKNKKMKNRLKKRVRKQVINRKVDRLVLRTKAEEAGVSVSQDEVNEKIQSAKKRFKSEEKFEKILSKRGMTQEEFRTNIRQQLMVQKFLESKMGPVSVSDSEARNYYERNKQRFKDQSFEQLKPRLKRALKQQKSRKKQQELVNRLRKKSEVDIRV